MAATGNNPRIKLLLLHGGPGITHEYLEPFATCAWLQEQDFPEITRPAALAGSRISTVCQGALLGRSSDDPLPRRLRAGPRPRRRRVDHHVGVPAPNPHRIATRVPPASRVDQRQRR